MKRLIFIAVVFLVTLSGCMKNCEHNLLPDSIRPFLFKEGSRWVFTNSTTGINDTFAVIKSDSEIKYDQGPTRCKDRTDELYAMTIVNSSDTFFVSAFSHPYFRLSNAPFTIQGDIFDASISSGQCSRYDNRLCLTNVSSLSVGANTFNEAYEITTTMIDGNGNELFLCDMFWVKNIGVVKIILHDSHSSTFNLLSWNVVQ